MSRKISEEEAAAIIIVIDYARHASWTVPLEDFQDAAFLSLPEWAMPTYTL